jgi:hypothetical protein
MAAWVLLGCLNNLYISLAWQRNGNVEGGNSNQFVDSQEAAGFFGEFIYGI